MHIPTAADVRRTILGVGSYLETIRIDRILRRETVGGGLLVAAALVAIVLANSPAADWYFALRDTEIGYEPWHLKLSLGAWAADGLLAVFFFLVGLELKREFIVGDLRDLQKAAVPVAAACGGVIVPAAIYAVINMGNPAGLTGWAIPTATDIAFALAVLAVIGSHLPTVLRIFLMTLAVTDDLIAIVIIAIFYTSDIQVLPLLLAVLPIAVYWYLGMRQPKFFATRWWAHWVFLMPLGLAAWALVHASGIHATIAAVVLGFGVRVKRLDRRPGPGLSEIFEHRFRPLSTGFAVPVFAFFSAGVRLGGWDGVLSAFGDRVTIGVVGGLIIGKPLGILGATWLLTKFTRATLDQALRWIDLIGVGCLGSIGFTVSLLVSELSFGHSVLNDHAKVGIIAASLGAALIASLVLVPRNAHYHRIERELAVDEDGDGIPDGYQRTNT